jgi:hypothetical protein
MPTQLRLFSTNGSENFSDRIQPVNSQTTTCAIANGESDKQSQAVIVALWYLEPPERERGHH